MRWLHFHNERGKEFKLPIYVALIGNIEAFYKVNHQIIWNILSQISFSQYLIRATQSLYMDTKIKIERSSKISKTQN